MVRVVIVDALAGLVPTKHGSKEIEGVLLAWEAPGFRDEWLGRHLRLRAPIHKGTRLPTALGRSMNIYHEKLVNNFRVYLAGSD